MIINDLDGYYIVKTGTQNWTPYFFTFKYYFFTLKFPWLVRTM